MMYIEEDFARLLQSILFIGVFTYINILFFPKYYIYLFKLKKAEGVILSFVKVDSTKGLDRYHLEIEYSTNYTKINTKVIYEAFFLVRKEHPEVGKKIQIRYNPQNPYEVASISNSIAILELCVLMLSWISLLFIFFYYLGI